MMRFILLIQFFLVLFLNIQVISSQSTHRYTQNEHTQQHPTKNNQQQQTNPQSINWIEFADLADSMRNNPRPVLVFITADWCPYCKLQRSKTFAKKQATSELAGYYCLELDAEFPETIQFLNRSYHFEPTGVRTGTHQLARLLGSDDGQLVLPTTVLLNDKLQLMSRKKGYLGPQDFSRWLFSHKKRSHQP